MIRSLIKLGLLLVVGIVAYNYFWGTAEEKESSQRIFNEVKNIGRSVGDLLRSEKEKYDSGKYDDALAKIGDAFRTIRDKAEVITENGGEYLEKLKVLEAKKEELERQLAETKRENRDGEELTEKGKREMKNLESEIRDLIRKTEAVAEDIDKEE